MEFNLKKTTLLRKQILLDSASRQPVDMDVVLPDYCPDIEKILCCRLVPQIRSKTVSGGQLSVEGNAVVRILYLDSEKGRIRCYEPEEPFSANFPLKTTPEVFSAAVEAKCEYLNCRALTPRKLSVHGAFSLCAKVIAPGACDFFEKDDDSALRVKTEQLDAFDFSCLAEEQFSVTEDISFDDKPPLESILSSEVSVMITDVKSIAGKMMITASGKLRLLYLSDLEKGEMEHLLYTFPISRVIDCEEATDETLIDARLEVMGYEIKISTDALSEGALATLELGCSLSVFGYEKKTVAFISDAFSTESAVKLTREEKTVDTALSLSRFSSIKKAEISLEDVGVEGVGEVVELSCDAVSVTPMPQDNSVMLHTKAVLCLLMLDQKSEPFYLERSVELEVSPEKQPDDPVEQARVSLENLSYRIVDEKHLQVRMELCYTLLSREETLIRSVSEAQQIDEPTEKDDSAMVIYYGESGESVWNIAKAWRCDPDVLCEENALESDELEENTMLLIPVD